jgi:hypothetical protein
MTISKDLSMFILSMDSYNCGYNSGIAGLDDSSDRAHIPSLDEAKSLAVVGDWLHACGAGA